MDVLRDIQDMIDSNLSDDEIRAILGQRPFLDQRPKKILGEFHCLRDWLEEVAKIISQPYVEPSDDE